MGVFAHDFIMFDKSGSARLPELINTQFRARGSKSAQPDCMRGNIVNGGCVALLHAGAGLIVYLRPSHVHPRALAAALYHLADAAVSGEGPGKIVILGQRKSELHVPTRRDLVETLCKLVNDADPSNQQRFARREASRTEIAPTSPVAGLASIWHEVGGRFDRERLWRCLTGEFGQRFVVVSTEPGAMRVKSLGGGFSELAQYWWPVSGEDVRLTDQPDVHYGRWIEDVYREADRKDQPLIEAVDCEIDWPREGLRRHRYWRFIAPFQCENGRRIVLGATLVDNNIGLRSDGVAALAT